jgi:hypothetical protein
MAGYVDILATLRSIPCTTRGLSLMGICSATSAEKILPAFHKLGLVHISGWLQRYRAPARPQYKFGQGEDAQPPEFRKSGKRVKRVVPPIKAYVVPPEILSFYTAFNALQTPITRDQLVDATGISYNTMRNLLAALRKHHMVRIESYERISNGGPPAAYFVLGFGGDAKRPSSDKKAREARYRAKRRQIQIIQRMAGRSANDSIEKVAA